MKKNNKIICVCMVLVVLLSMCIIPISASWQDSDREVRYVPQYVLSTTGKDGDVISVNLTPVLDVTNTTSITENLINNTTNQGIFYNNITIDNFNVTYDLDIDEYGGYPLTIIAENFYISNYNDNTPNIVIPSGYDASINVEIDYVRPTDSTQTVNTFRYGLFDAVGEQRLISVQKYQELFGDDHYLFIKKYSCNIILSEISAVNEVASYNLDGQSRDTTITDLTGTEWYIPSGWSAISGLGVYYSLFGTIAYNLNSSSVTGEPISFPGDGIAIGYRFVDPVDGFAPLADTFAIPYIANLNPQYELWISIDGGSDATDSVLISWLDTYGSLVVDTPTLATPTLSYDTTTDIFTVSGYDNYTTGYHIYANGQYITNRSLPDNTFTLESLGLGEGTYSITVVAVASDYNDSASSNSISVIVEAEPITIPLTFEYSLMTQDTYFNIIDQYTDTYVRVYFNSNNTLDDVDLGSWIANAVGGFLDAELFPGFSFGGILGIMLAICVVVVFLKIFAGG